MKYKTIVILTFISAAIFGFKYSQDLPVALKVGDKAPNFKAKAHSGEILHLDSLLKKGPVVLFFYRGAWCPYCNKQMSELQDSLSLITSKGAAVIAISPEIPENIEKTIRKTNASFSIIHDKEYAIMKAYKTAFKVDSNTVEKYKKWNIDLESANGNRDNMLPVPATYIIDQKGNIKYVYFDADYRKRVSVKTILEKL